jgi:hypothetical protein
MDDAPLLRLVGAAVDAVRDDLPCGLRGPYDDVARGVAARFLSVDAQPVVRLPRWLAPELAPDDEAGLVRGGVAGYLAFRVLDDWFDEDRGDPHTVAALSQALAVDHHTAVARVAPDPAFLDLARRRWAEAVAALRDERAQGPRAASAATFDRALDVSRAGGLPGAAALASVGRWRAWPVAERILDGFLVGHQLLEDLYDAPVDWRHGRRTWAASRAHSGPVDALEWRAGLGWLAVHDEAVQALQRAREAALDAGLGAWAAALDARAEDALARRDALAGGLGRTILGPPRP